MTASVPLEVAPSAFAGLIGLARRDTTPPTGIYARMWGAATWDFAEGVHRPLSTTALALRETTDGARPRLLVALDLEDAEVGVLAHASPDVRPMARALPLLRVRLLSRQQVVACRRVHARRQRDVHADRVQLHQAGSSTKS